MDWLSLAVGLLKLANAIMGWVNRKQAMDAGRDAEIAREATSILRQTTAGKKLMERIDALSDSELDDLTDAIGRAS